MPTRKSELTPVSRPLTDLLVDPVNARVHTTRNIDAIRASLRTFGQRRAIIVDRNGVIVAGNGTFEAAKAENWTTIECVVFPGDPAEARAYAIADNRTAELAEWDYDILLEQLGTFDPDMLAAVGFDPDELAELQQAALDGVGFGLGGAGGSSSHETGALAERFGVPPFTLLDARRGPWRARRRAWQALGIQSELGRRDDLLIGGKLAGDMDHYRNEAKAQSGYGSKAITTEDGRLEYEPTLGGTSIFDPVLTELIYRWFSAKGARVLDPWAGGSVRGIVASHLDRSYTGIELRPEQVAANVDQLRLAADRHPQWIEGESTEQLMQMIDNSFDLIIGCPPYYDLERYSDDPRDLSTMTRAQFDKAMRANIAAAASLLVTDSFAVFVVGNVRDKSGTLLDMRGLLVNCCEAAGLRFYNDAVLVTPAGSLPVRTGKAFLSSRVMGRTHQEVLVFVKGDRRKAAERAGEVDVEVDLEAAAASHEWDDDEQVEEQDEGV